MFLIIGQSRIQNQKWLFVCFSFCILSATFFQVFLFPKDLHPIDFLDEVGEVICDLTGTCVDLFEPWLTTWVPFVSCQPV